MAKAAAKTNAGKPVRGRPFQPGNPGGPGRPKGSKHKLGEDFLAELAADFAKHGAAVIAKVRAKAPAVYLRIVADLVPKDLNIAVVSHEEALRALA
jgi:hypothetical protein